MSHNLSDISANPRTLQDVVKFGVKEKPSGARVSGLVRGYQVPEAIPVGLTVEERLSRWEPCTPFVCNDLTYDWAVIVQRLLRGSPDGGQYKIGGMYLEFNNGGTVDPTPTITRGGWADYYANLNSSFATRDYLRVPLIATSEETTNPLFSYPNQANFIAQTVGVGPEGTHGLVFSDANSSYVYGGALVAFVNGDDSSNDIVFNRFYFAEANQLEKLAGRQLGINWPLILA